MFVRLRLLAVTAENDSNSSESPRGRRNILSNLWHLASLYLCEIKPFDNGIQQIHRPLFQGLLSIKKTYFETLVHRRLMDAAAERRLKAVRGVRLPSPEAERRSRRSMGTGNGNIDF